MKTTLAIGSVLLSFAGCNGDPEPDACIEPWAGPVETPTTWGSTCTEVDVTESITVEAPLTILPGTTVRVAEGSSISIQTGGSLTAEGTAEEPILLLGQSEVPGSWGSLAFGSVSSDNRMSNVTVRHGCGSGFQFNDWGIVVQGDSTSAGSLRMSDVTIAECTGVGLRVMQGGRIEGSTDVSFDTITDGHPVEIPFQHAGDIDTSWTFTNIQRASVLVTRGDLETQASWSPLEVPYQVQVSGVIDDGGALTIEAGTTVLFEQDAVLATSGGTLSVLGTPDAPVNLLGVENIAGYWGGLAFQSLSVDNVIEDTLIGDAGGANYQGESFAIVVTGSSTSEASLTIRDSTIDNSEGGGVKVREGGMLTAVNVDYTDVAGEDLVDDNL